MPDQNLLIPGTQATTLQDQNGKTVYNAVRVNMGLQKDSLGDRPESEWKDLFSLEYTPGMLEPTKTSLLPDTEIVAGEPVMTPYDRLPKPLDKWGYDWRLDMRYNAQQLLQYLRDHKPADGRFNLMGHSQGGIVIVLSSLYTNDPDEFASLVARVILIGTPIGGTQKALGAIAVGRGDFGDDDERWDIAREMAQTWPSLYQMLPAWASVLNPDGTPADADKQFTSIGGYPGVYAGGIRDDLLLRARETHDMLKDPLAKMNGVAVRVIEGDKQDTPVCITRTGDELATTGEQHGSRPELDFQDEPGDTLVPCQETLDWAGDTYTQATLKVGGRVKEHAMLCDSTMVINLINDWLDKPAPPAP